MNKPVRILYIDDYPLDRELVRDALEKEHGGFEVVEAASRADFETTLAQGGFDLILSDFNILGFEGLQVLEAVRATNSNLPVIIVTGTGSEEVAAEAIKRGAADYVIKTPKHIQRLAQTIHTVLEKKRLEDEHKQGEEALFKAEAKHRALVEQIPVVAYTDSAGHPSHTEYISPRVEEVFGCTAEEWIADDNLWPNFIFPEDRDRVRAVNLHANETGESFNIEYRIVKKDGQTRWILDQAVLIRDEFGKPLFWQGVMSDVTERKQAEEAFRKSEEKYRVTFENTGTATVLIEKDTTISLGNAEFERLSGYSKSEIEGKKKWTDFVVKEDLDRMLEQHSLRRKDPNAALKYYEFRFITRSGKIRDILLSIDMIPSTQTSIASLLDITERKQAEEEVHNLNAELEQRVEERTRELREAQEQLILQEKLAMLGQLAGGVGHELRNPLGVILNAIYYLKLIQPDADDKTKQYHDMIEQEAHNAEKTVSDLLDYARAIPMDRQTVSVPELVQRTLSHYPTPPFVKVTIKIPADLPQVYADPRQMEQMLGNLTVNAYQAMAAHTSSAAGGSEGGKLTISAHRQEEMVAIAVKDNGVGIPPENMPKLFEPLFSTKINGIGLGLPISKKLVEANNGRIEVQSKLGKGSTFTIYLPVSS